MSELLKMSLALENDQLQRRVQAAVIAQSQRMLNDKAERGIFARMVLADMRVEWDDFLVLVAADSDIQDAIAVSDDNSFIVASNVTDQAITDIINRTYMTISKKYAATQAPEEESGGADA